MPGRAQMAARPLLRVLHRFVGLGTAGFLFVAGMTGSILAFNHELDEWLNPELFHATSSGPALSPAELTARVEQSDPRIRVVFLPAKAEPGHTVTLIVHGRRNLTGGAAGLEYNQVFVDPATATVVGKRNWGAFRFDRAHLIPCLYVLHYTLHLPAAWGTVLMGVVAIVWMFDCIVGLLLTVPQRAPRLAKWRSAWTIKAGTQAGRMTLDLHRASGLWLWGALFAVAMSGVALSLNEQVFRPVVSLFSTLTPSLRDVAMPRLRTAIVEPRMSFDDIASRAQQELERRGWRDEISNLLYTPRFGSYGVSIGDGHAAGFGPSWMYFDDQTGDLLHADIRGVGSAGDVFLHLQFPLHSGQVAGLAGRIVIAAAGLVVAVLSVTGVLIWYRRWRARSGAPATTPRRASGAAATPPA